MDANKIHKHAGKRFRTKQKTRNKKRVQRQNKKITRQIPLGELNMTTKKKKRNNTQDKEKHYDDIYYKENTDDVDWISVAEDSIKPESKEIAS
jgi:hypothetical protein